MAGNRENKSAFQIAIEKTEDVKGGFCKGKQAIKNVDRGRIELAVESMLDGSLDIDGQVKTLYPNDPRWDYALSYNDTVYFVEVHPAETSEVDKVISKVRWLKNWLRTRAIQIDGLPKAERPYTWLQSGRFAILPTSRAKMKLSAAGITVVNKLRLK